MSECVLENMDNCCNILKDIIYMTKTVNGVITRYYYDSTRLIYISMMEITRFTLPMTRTTK